jgi:hypothetical protein
MSDRELELIAEKYHIPPMSLPPGDADWGHAYIDRDRIIGILVARDNALRTKLTTVLSIVALLLSVVALVKSFFVASGAAQPR